MFRQQKCCFTVLSGTTPLFSHSYLHSSTFYLTTKVNIPVHSHSPEARHTQTLVQEVRVWQRLTVILYDALDCVPSEF